MRLIYYVSVLLTFGLVMPAYALNLDEARQNGLVGETLSGYLAARQNNAEINALVSRINSGRQQQYQRVAQQNNMTTEAVARIAGQKLVNRAANGEYVRGINGKWMRKQ